MRVCHVGAERPYTMQDRMRRVQAMAHTNPRTWEYALEEDIVNLLYERDFLTEDHTYDIVLVHSVFHTNHPDMLAASIRDAVAAGPSKALVPISAEHSLRNWRERLKTTNAQYLLVFEDQPVSLSGWNLGDIEGYTMEFPTPNMALYRRNV